MAEPQFVHMIDFAVATIKYQINVFQQINLQKVKFCLRAHLASPGQLVAEKDDYLVVQSSQQTFVPMSLQPQLATSVASELFVVEKITELLNY